MVNDLQLGNLAEWVAAVGTVGALILTYRLLSHEIQMRRRADADRAHAVVSQRRALVVAALDEVRSNRAIAEAPHDHYVWYPFALDAVVDLARELPAHSSASPAVAALRSEVTRYNAAATYSNEKVTFGSGAMDAYMEKRTEALKSVLQSAAAALEDLLASLQTRQASGAMWGEVESARLGSE